MATPSYTTAVTKVGTAVTKVLESKLTPQNVFAVHLEKSSLDNKAYRKVINTNEQQQLVLMYLKAGVEIGDEVHQSSQFIRLEKGKAQAIITTKEGKMTYEMNDGDSITIGKGTQHNIIAISDANLYTVYSPPVHKDGLVQADKPLEEDEDDKPKCPCEKDKKLDIIVTAPPGGLTVTPIVDDQSAGNWVIRSTYDNMAWSTIHKGFWITADGSVYQYDVKEQYPRWADKIKMSSKVGVINRLEWDKWLKYLNMINSDAKVVETGMAFDAGYYDISIMSGKGILSLNFDGNKAGYLDDEAAKVLVQLVSAIEI